jgi:small GTP-binding protein
MQPYNIAVLGEVGVRCAFDLVCVFRCLLVHITQAGKSCLVQRLFFNQWIDEMDPTIEDAFSKTVQLGGKEIQLDILDSGGREEFSVMRDKFVCSYPTFLEWPDIVHGLIPLHTVPSNACCLGLLRYNS